MSLHRNLAASLLALAALYGMAGDADAVTTCTASTTPLSSGTVTGAANVDTTALVTVNCTTTGLSALATARVRMCLNIGAGVNGAGQTNPRRMTNSFGDALQFQIFRDAARTQIWGDSNIAATPTPVLIDLQYSVPLLGGSGSTSTTLHARVPAQTGLAAGSHSNPFTGTHTRLQYRYAESTIGTPSYPASCTSGGIGGGGITFPFTASATVPNHCTISTATNLAFGAVPGRIDANQDQTSTLTFTCTGRTAWNVALNNGQNAVGNTRRMRLGSTASHVTYELYRNAARTQRWGATVGTDTAAGTGAGSAQSLTVFGRVPATQVVPAGTYGDTITVTVTY
ncbi:spore coat U domain-containing protein [Luteimonas aestuarii]|uniref:Spore coat U domain-containing protein n=1 Tax=Luteimonas aestuarii TaxID=453837 RepID=A0A4R5TY52_9GAMM|nr:spore coat U domain-containing protein [Luteimonas aestuarii]TDK26081.1 spore coat U domain-containing protein [Luteimonas aestuarii]